MATASKTASVKRGRRFAPAAGGVLVLWAASLPASGAQPAQDGVRPGNEVGTGQSLPRSDAAGNLGPGTTRSELAPNLPSPASGQDDPRSLLLAARDALQNGRTGAAQEALERAETRALDRSVPYGTQAVPAHAALPDTIAAALRALDDGRAGDAVGIIDRALADLSG